MKNKCLILTLKTKNYGGILQAYALQKFIKNLGHDAITSDLSIKKRKKSFGRTIVSYLNKNFFERLLGDKKRKTRTKEFLNQNLDRTIKLKEAEFDKYISNNNFYNIVVGSDQVWNDKMFNTSSVFFFPYTTNSNLISYAASFGYSLSANQPYKYHLKLLRSFNSISVREKDACEYLLKNDIKATTVLDPTFLIDKAEWEKLASCSKIKHEPGTYGFVYLMPGDSATTSYIRKLALYYSKLFGCKFYVVGSKDIEKYKYKKTDLFGVGPAEWIYLLSNAEYVITNSFHGTVFSLIFNKKFVSVISKNSLVNYPNRIIDLLKSINSEDHLLDISSEVMPTSISSVLDFEKKISKQIAFSKEWLRENLKND